MNLTWTDVEQRASETFARIVESFAPVPLGRPVRLYGVPRGGIHALSAVDAACGIAHGSFSVAEFPIERVSKAEQADAYVDDIVDTGETRRQYFQAYGARPWFALVDKEMEGISAWVKFPWEMDSGEVGPEENIRRILQYIGEDPKREGLLETPSRVVKSYAELFSGYRYKTEEEIGSLLKVFTDGACDEMILVKDIEFVSMCEHHMLPFSGVAHIAYLPKDQIVGLSKLARIVDVYARRLQVQERLTQQVTESLMKHLQPNGVACVIEAHHQCMSCRGVKKANAKMVTSSLTGAFREPAARAEFYSLIRG